MNRRLLFLPGFARLGDLALLGLRLLTGAFLVRLALPGTLAATSPMFVQIVLWLTLATGIALLLGLVTRLAGLLCLLAALGAMLSVHRPDTVREAWPIAALALTGLLIAGLGPGRFAVERIMSIGRLAATRLGRLAGPALLIARVATGLFLIHGVWDNISEAARMTEFVQFVRANHIPLPEVAARLSVWTQFIAGIGLVLGALTRWSALLLIANMAVAVAFVHWGEKFADIWPAAILIAFGAVFLSFGAGPLALDRRLEHRP